jgi:hypothetical protein
MVWYGSDILIFWILKIMGSNPGKLSASKNQDCDKYLIALACGPQTQYVVCNIAPCVCYQPSWLGMFDWFAPLKTWHFDRFVV